jgi:hypothetical protein
MTKEIEEVFNKEGFFLGAEGINNWALSKGSAIRVLLQLEKRNIPILGGDVLEKNGDKFQYNCDNWYYNIKSSADSRSVKESHLRARDYISNYPDNENFFFALVIK